MCSDPSERPSDLDRTTIPDGLSPDDIAILRAIKDSIPDADARSPTEVLEFVAKAVGAYNAKVIEPPDCTE